MDKAAMRIDAMQTTLNYAKANRLWAVAYGATLLLPLMLIWARVGMEICGGIIGLAFLFHSHHVKEWQWVRSPFTVLCFVAWAWLVFIVTPLAVTPFKGLVDALMWMRMPLMFLALRYWVLALPQPRLTLATVLAGLLVLIAIDCVVQFATGTSLSGNPRLVSLRLTGPFNAPKVGHFIGQLAVPAIGLCLAAAVARQNTRAIVGCLGLLAVMMVTILLCGERSAFLTLLMASGVTMGLLMLAEPRLRKLGLLLAVVTLLGLGLLYCASAWIQERTEQTMDAIAHYQESDYGLLAMAGIDMGMAHPVHGVGVRGFRELCPELPHKESSFKGLHPHNFFVEWFAEAGTVGLLLFLGLIGLLGREAMQQYRAQDGLMKLLSAAALGVLVQHYFPLMGMQSFFNNWSAALQWYGLALMFAALPVKTPARKPTK
ncbi:MAG: O-antigen ligase family protein [Rickettsiales bacterium]